MGGPALHCLQYVLAGHCLQRCAALHQLLRGLCQECCKSPLRSNLKSCACCSVVQAGQLHFMRNDQVSILCFQPIMLQALHCLQAPLQRTLPAALYSSSTAPQKALSEMLQQPIEALFGELCMLQRSAGWATGLHTQCFEFLKSWQVMIRCTCSCTALLAEGTRRTLPTALRSSSAAPQSALSRMLQEPTDEIPEELCMPQHCAGQPTAIHAFQCSSQHFMLQALHCLQALLQRTLPTVLHSFSSAPQQALAGMLQKIF